MNKEIQNYMKSFVDWLNKSFEDEIKWAEEEIDKSNNDTRKAFYEGRIESAKEWLETLKHLAWDDEGDDDKC